VQTPANVAKAYVEVRFADDWTGAWSVLCRETRSTWVSYATYAENANYVNEYYAMPSDVDVSIGEVHDSRELGRAAAVVAMTVTSDERYREDWETGGDLLIVEEEGEFRVCNDGVARS
jgi:hypothetical protein